jgi:hypothetical protein
MDQPTLIETTDGHIVALSVDGERVSLTWSGPRHAELTPEEARTVGYVLRGYARMADDAPDPAG